jgi:signal transduction histidine kinase
MNVSAILRKKGEAIFSVRPESTLREAVRLMAERRIGTVTVTDDDDRLVGILSERDMVRILNDGQSGSRELPVGGLCTRGVITCREDNSIEDVMTLMSNNGVRHLPVMRDGRAVAMISARDVLDAQKEALLAIVQHQKRAYGLVLRSKEQAEQANRSKTEFLNRMSHELRTPLHAIIGFGELVERDAHNPAAPPHLGSYAAEIQGAGRHLLDIVNDILDMSRLEIGDWQAADEHLEMHAEARAVVEEYADEAARGGITLREDMMPPPIGLIADRAMVRQMLGNLLSNAIKFTTQGGSVTLRLYSSAEEGLRLSVIDTGIGIPEDAVDAVIRPFSQADETLSRSHGGTGLGLSIVDTMMALHDGALEIKSARGKGTTVTLRFPPARLTAATAATGIRGLAEG